LRAKETTEDEIEISARIGLRYSDAPNNDLSIVRIITDDNEKEVKIFPMDNQHVENMRI
jgi:hypothetical protein